MEVKFEIKLTVGETTIDEEHTFEIVCTRRCIKSEMIRAALDRFYKDTKKKLLRML